MAGGAISPCMIMVDYSSYHETHVTYEASYLLFFCFHQVICALTLNHTKRQWVDLGIHTEACMTQPETCGAAGGAISMWLKLLDSPSPSGIISSWSSDSTGSMINFQTGNLWYDWLLSDSIYHK